MSAEENESPAAQVQVEIVDEPSKEVKEKKEEDDVKDSWDADSTEEEHEEEEGIVSVCTHKKLRSCSSVVCIYI